MKKAVFKMSHAGCPSCRLAIEHAGRRIKGVSSIDVDLATGKINVDYDGPETEVINSVRDIVERIGYEAVLLSS